MGGPPGGGYAGGAGMPPPGMMMQPPQQQQQQPQGGMLSMMGMAGMLQPGGSGGGGLGMGGAPGYGQYDAPPAAPPVAQPAAPADPRMRSGGGAAPPPPAAYAPAPQQSGGGGGALPVEAGGPGWRGSIAKSGGAVCSVACVRGAPGALPAELNCTARTDLNNLALHLAAVPFRVIQLAPATAADVAPLQEFVTYLLERQRAGVAKAGDATVFLVPPSEWAGRVLHCEPTANLLGVVVSTALVPAAQPAGAAAAAAAAAQQQQAPSGTAFGKGLYSAPPQQQPQAPPPYGGYAPPQPLQQPLQPATSAAMPSAAELAHLVSLAGAFGGAFAPPR
jgi:hypothetical protein